MPRPDPTTANRALWRAHARNSWGRWLAPLGGDAAADLLADTISRFYTTAFGDAIEQLYVENAPDVTRFVDARRPLPATDEDANAENTPEQPALRERAAAQT